MTISEISALPDTKSEVFRSSFTKIRRFIRGEVQLTPQELFTELKKDLILRELLEKNSGTGEGFSIGEHALMVVESFSKEFITNTQVEKILTEADLPPNVFMLFLSLHDIGKGVAVERFGLHNSPERKQEELKQNQVILARYFTEFQAEEYTPILSALLETDVVGTVLKQKNPSEEFMLDIAKDIRKSAVSAQLPIKKFFALQVLFHFVDAASYPYLRVNIFAIDLHNRVELGNHSVPGLLGHSPANSRKLMQMCQHLQVSGDALPLKIKPFYDLIERVEATFQNIRKLEKQRAEYKNSASKEERVASLQYRNIVEALNKQKMELLPFRLARIAKAEGSFPVNYEGKVFRQARDYEKYLLQELADKPHLEQALENLSRLTCLHGSNSVSLAMMSETGYSLISLGELSAMGIAPLSGEQDLGATFHGVNQHGNISAQTVENYQEVKKYAEEISFQGLKPKDFLEYLENPEHSFFMRFFPKLTLFLSKKALEDSDGLVDLIQENKETLRKGLENLRKVYKNFTNDHYFEPLEDLIVYQAVDDDFYNEHKFFFDQGVYTHTFEEYLVDCIKNPFLPLLEESRWEDFSLKLLQFRQWNEDQYTARIAKRLPDMLKAIDYQKDLAMRPLKILEALLDREVELTQTESRAIRNYSPLKYNFSSMQLPSGVLKSLGLAQHVTHQDTLNRIKSLYPYRADIEPWEALLGSAAYEKALGFANVDEKQLQKVRGFIKVEQKSIENRAAKLRHELTRKTPRYVLADQVKELMREPFPVIYASTLIAPTRHSSGTEYILPRAVPLGREGCDVLITDCEESKNKIERMLPNHLNKEINIWTYDKVFVGKEVSFKVISSPRQKIQ